MTVTRILVLVALLVCVLGLAERSALTRKLATRLMSGAARRTYAHDPARRTRRAEEWEALGLGRSTVAFLTAAIFFAASSVAWSAVNRRKSLGEPGQPLEGGSGNWIGNALIFLTSADGELIGSRSERYRYAAIGLQMLVTAAQAFYVSTLFMSISLGKPFGSVIYFGVFYTASVFLIDRSVISYVAPVKLDKQGNLRPPKRVNGVLAVRVFISLAAAALMAEMILLQVFASDIEAQVQADHIAAATTTDNQIKASYEAPIKVLQSQVDNAQANVSASQAIVGSAYQAMNCQEFGCPGIAPGLGPGFAAAQETFRNAQQRLTGARDQLRAIRGKNLPRIQQLNTAERQAVEAAQHPVANTNMVLSREQAFWQLTLKSSTVLVVRVLLSLLIMGIDLAPILTKLTGRITLHDISAHALQYRLLEQHRHEVELAIRQDRARRVAAAARRSTEQGGSLTSLIGVGSVIATQIRDEAADLSRFTTQDEFASYNGNAPIAVSSGGQVHHRLSRTGNRQINRALTTIAISQIHHPATGGRRYYERKRTEGMTSKKALRCLTRRLSDQIYRQLTLDAQSDNKVQ